MIHSSVQEDMKSELIILMELKLVSEFVIMMRNMDGVRTDTKLGLITLMELKFVTGNMIMYEQHRHVLSCFSGQRAIARKYVESTQSDNP